MDAHRDLDYPGGVPALVVMLLLGFLLVIAASLTIWAALTLSEHSPAPAPRAGREPPVEPQPLASRPSNDELRGARARASRRSGVADDAFERFVRSDDRRDESKF